ncbi:MAG: xanthine dehydrogenase family protein molybdopterin-binding subunit [Planctomycetes bacterium]|nr:xanthine dehydrogenase family protein molybdopterin-binding subunit [Planctomycetota bacterium]
MAESKVKLGVADVVAEKTIRHEDADPAPWGLDARLAVVGTEVSRVDGFAKASGAARYAGDQRPTGLAFARIVRCPHAHANVTRVDLDAVRTMPGVLAADETGGRRKTYAGAPVAVVCAADERSLDDAVAAVRVSYEVLPHVVDATEALAEGAAQVDPKRANRGDADGRGRGGGPAGDAQKALDEAELKVEATYRTQVQTHVPLEPHGSVATWSEDGKLTLWCSTQSVDAVRNEMARRFQVPAADVRVVTEFMGGGFGCKFGPDPCDYEAVRLARATKRPVWCMNDRREEHLTGGFRPDSVQKLTLGGRRDGTMTVIAGECYGTPGNGQGGAGAANTALYDIPARGVTQFGVSTFTAHGRAFRAPGHPQGVFALEGLVDEFALAAGMDPLDVRRLNDKHPVRRLEWPVGAKRIGWAQHRRKVPGSDRGPVKRGVGCAGGVWYNAGGGSWRIDVAVARDGSVVVRSGVQDIGTGTKTVLAVLVAEELGVAPGAVRVEIGDSRFPPGPGSGGSTTAPSVGPAAREAGVRAREGVAAVVAAAWGVDADKLSFAGGRVRGPGGKETTFEQACAQLPSEGLSVSGVRRKNYEGFSGTCGGVQFARVAVDVETGVVRVEKVVAVHDAGRIVDTLTARSQVNGGVIQGISYALFEEKRLDRASGDMVNPTFDTYRIAGMADTPEIDVVFMDVANGINNVGMMGLGEPATVPTAAAVANAVANATGVRMRELPMTPARVLAALAAARGGGK